MKPLSRLIIVCTIVGLVLGSIHASFAGSATWNANPRSGDWNTAANWTPDTVPNGLNDTASFGLSNITSVSPSDKIAISGIEFVAGASPFTITVVTQRKLQIVGTGITNDSGVAQNFIVGTDVAGTKNASLLFSGSATAGSMSSFTNLGLHGYISFLDQSSAGSGTFTNLQLRSGTEGGIIEFYGNATADHATRGSGD